MIFYVLLFILALVTPSFGAVLEDLATTQSATGADTLSFSHTFTGSDGIIFAAVQYYDSSLETVTDCDFNGAALSEVNTMLVDPSNVGLHVWSRLAPATGAHSATCNFSGSVSAIVMGVATYTGAASLGTPVTVVTPSFVETSVDVTGATNGMVIDFAVIEVDAIETVTPSQTPVYDNSDITNLRAVSSKAAGSGTKTMYWSWTNGTYSAQLGVLINPSTAVAVRRKPIIIQ